MCDIYIPSSSSCLHATSSNTIKCHKIPKPAITKLYCWLKSLDAQEYGGGLHHFDDSESSPSRLVCHEAKGFSFALLDQASATNKPRALPSCRIAWRISNSFSTSDIRKPQTPTFKHYSSYISLASICREWRNRLLPRVQVFLFKKCFVAATRVARKIFVIIRDLDTIPCILCCNFIRRTWDWVKIRHAANEPQDAFFRSADYSNWDASICGLICCYHLNNG